MMTYTAVVERDIETGLYVGYVPGFPSVNTQGETLDELRSNLAEVISMLLEEDALQQESEFVGVESIAV